MWYAIVAPGVSGVYDNYEYIKRIKALYPYCKFRTFATEEEGYTFIKRFRNLHDFTSLYKYGDTFESLYVTMQYFVYNNSIYYNFKTNGIGTLRLSYPNAIIDYKANLIMVQLPNMKLNKDLISSSMIAIYHGLEIIGDFLDVVIEIPNHSVFYAIHSYNGSNRIINRVKDKIKNRLGNISVTLLNVKEKE